MTIALAAVAAICVTVVPFMTTLTIDNHYLDDIRDGRRREITFMSSSRCLNEG